MKQISRFFVTAALLLSSLGMAYAQKPYLKEVNGIQRLFYRDKPFLLLSGELHNSTGSTVDYLAPAMNSLKQMHLNSVIVTAEWDLIEPEQGKYDFSSIDNIITLAEKNDFPVVIAWFGTWKNGVSSYIPGWMKRDTKKYFRARNAEGEATDYISAFCSAARDADAKAFAAVMKYIKERDKHNYVLFMQVENETGLWQQNIDHCKEAQKAFSSKVPQELIAYLQKGKGDKDNPMWVYWTHQGKKTSGTWKEVFGDNAFAENFFTQWSYASYIEAVAKAGRQEYDIPMYLNTVAIPPFAFAKPNPGLIQSSDDQKAKKSPFGGGAPIFPSGAPTPPAFEMYHLFAPSIDFMSPDIYATGLFKPICDAYATKDNLLFIPETSRDAEPAYYAFAKCNALGFSAFAVEDAFLNKNYVLTYETLAELLPIISEYQGTGKMTGFLRERDETGTSFELEGYTIDVTYVKEESRAFGLVIKTGPEDFVFSGIGCMVKVRKNDEKKITRFEWVQEGHFEGTEWHNEVWLNGDQTGHGQELYLRGRVDYANEFTPSAGQAYPKRNVASSETTQDIVTSRLKSPSVHRVKVYTYDK